MAKKSTKKSPAKPKKKYNMSALLRRAMQYFADNDWDLNTISTDEIVAKARTYVANNDKAKFNPFESQVSIVKREFTGGSPTGKRGRPTHVAIGLVEAA